MTVNHSILLFPSCGGAKQNLVTLYTVLTTLAEPPTFIFHSSFRRVSDEKNPNFIKLYCILDDNDTQTNYWTWDWCKYQYTS